MIKWPIRGCWSSSDVIPIFWYYFQLKGDPGVFCLEVDNIERYFYEKWHMRVCGCNTRLTRENKGETLKLSTVELSSYKPEEVSQMLSFMTPVQQVQAILTFKPKSLHFDSGK